MQEKSAPGPTLLATGLAATLLFVAALLLLFASSASLALASEKKGTVESYLRKCEACLADGWLTQNSRVFDYGQPYLAAVITFDLDAQGKLKHLKLRHSSGRAAADRLALLALKASSPLPSPPVCLSCPRHMAAVFDSSRFNPARLMFDEKIEPVIHLQMPY